jgi:hypothetical protein
MGVVIRTVVLVLVLVVALLVVSVVFWKTTALTQTSKVVKFKVTCEFVAVGVVIILGTVAGFIAGASITTGTGTGATIGVVLGAAAGVVMVGAATTGSTGTLPLLLVGTGTGAALVGTGREGRSPLAVDGYRDGSLEGIILTVGGIVSSAVGD